MGLALGDRVRDYEHPPHQASVSRIPTCSIWSTHPMGKVFATVSPRRASEQGCLIRIAETLRRRSVRAGVSRSAPLSENRPLDRILGRLDRTSVRKPAPGALGFRPRQAGSAGRSPLAPGTKLARSVWVPRPLRYVPAGSVVEITTRTIHGRFLLRPSPEVNDLILGILGRAKSLFPVQIHAFVVLSNHWHALLSVQDAAQLAAFVAFVNGNIARGIGRLHDWRQRFWSRRYRAIVVADEATQPARLKYILQNGCKEGIVDRPVDWPGLSCVRALTSNQELHGTWHDRTAEWNTCRGRREALPGSFSRRYSVELSPLPCWKHLSASGYRAACAELIACIEEETRAERAVSGRPCTGASSVLAQSPHPIGPRSPPAGPRPSSTPRVGKPGSTSAQRMPRSSTLFNRPPPDAASERPSRLGPSRRCPLRDVGPRRRLIRRQIRGGNERSRRCSSFSPG